MRLSQVEAKRALIEWHAANAQRNWIVSQAYLAGVSKRQICALSGLDRKTISRILKAASINQEGN